MKLEFPKGAALPLAAVAVVVLAYAAYFAVRVYAYPAHECCATGFDATPYQQVPARTLP